ncbi:MAG: hypothetical protein MJY84_03735, partial [Bacteroidales bacterium]|nr:hypothetical protein [Bacteroidales bacterium]
MTLKYSFLSSVALLTFAVTACFCTPVENLPSADIVDVRFNEDGTASNLSESGPQLFHSQTPTMDMPFMTGGRMVCPFSNDWGSKSASTSYWFDYKGNQDLMAALSEGHSFEVILRPHFEGRIPDHEIKIFSSISGGGTGLIISSATGDHGNEFAFIPFTKDGSDGNYRWALSGVVPESDVNYHVVGVWDKAAAKAKIYVNGVLMNTVDAPGELVFPSWDLFHKFTLGAGTHVHFPGGIDAFTGTISTARIYGRALADEEVAALYRSERKFIRKYQDPEFMRTVMFRNLAAKPGVLFSVFGTCFKAGDRLEFVPVTGDAERFTLDAVLEPDRITVTLPDCLQDTEYDVFALRGRYSQHIGRTCFTIVDTMPKPANVTPHQGDFNLTWAGQNTASSFLHAVKAGYYGSETDAQLTADGVIVINHDSLLKGVDINTSSYDEVKDLIVDDRNKEKIATLQQLLDILIDNPDSPTKLVLEIKRQANAPACVDSAVALVRRMGLQDRVDYISFDKDACREIAAQDVEGVSAYLDHDLDPYQVKELGVNCMDKAYPYMRDEWYDLSHELGLTVNIWTPDNAEEIAVMI